VLKHFLGRLGQVGLGLWLAQEVQQIADVTGAELHVSGLIDYGQVSSGQAGAVVAVLVVAPGAEYNDLLELVGHAPTAFPIVGQIRALAHTCKFRASRAVLGYLRGLGHLRADRGGA
jgi:hypothetical protein